MPPFSASSESKKEGRAASSVGVGVDAGSNFWGTLPQGFPEVPSLGGLPGMESKVLLMPGEDPVLADQAAGHVALF